MVSSLEKCPSFIVSFIERFRCTIRTFLLCQASFVPDQVGAHLTALLRIAAFLTASHDELEGCSMIRGPFFHETTYNSRERIVQYVYSC